MREEIRGPMEAEREGIVPAGVFPLIEPGHSFASLTEKISSVVLRRGTPLFWLGPFLLAFALLFRV